MSDPLLVEFIDGDAYIVAYDDYH